MEVYTPIIFPGTAEPKGALEIYQHYAPTAQRINDLRRWFFLSIGLGFVVLYAVSRELVPHAEAHEGVTRSLLRA